MSEQEITYLAANTVLKGELQLAGPATIAGRVEGAITGENPVQILAGGTVEGDVQGTVLDVQGTIKGNILASQLCRLGATAKVSGELRAANLAIVEGACFVGQVCVGGPSVEQELRPAAVQPQQVPARQPVQQAVQQPIQRPAHIPAQNVMQEMAAASSRIQALAAETQEMATVASASAESVPAGAVNIVQDNIENALRGPKIIRARG